MPLDPYAACPGGTGKKIKFCCPDLIGELEKIEHMLAADQHAGCLEYIESLGQKYPDRACLLSVKALLESELGMEEKAANTLSRYTEKYPENPVALAENATLIAAKDGGRAAVEPLQQAIAAAGDEMPLHLYRAIGVVAQALLGEGMILAARGHLMLQLSIGGSGDEQPLKMVASLNHSPAIPLVFKQDTPLLATPVDAPWKESLHAALQLAGRGAWQGAEKKLVELIQKVGDQPVLWRDLATLRAWLADNIGAVEALRKYAAQQIPLEDAVEAEALAQLLGDEGFEEIDVLSVPYEIGDVERLQTQLANDRRVVRIPIDVRRLGLEDQPPPKDAFWLLDRATPDSGVNIKREDIPRVVGRLFLFGKQTDRPARLELVTYRSRELAEALVGVADIGGDALGSPGSEVITGQADAIQQLLSSNWRLPEDTPPEHRAKLIAEERRDILLNRWAELPQQFLGGKSASQVAADPASRVKLLAAILLLETTTEQSLPDVDFNDVRRKLGLPTLEAIDPWKASPAQVPLLRLARLDVAKLSDEDLLHAYQRAEHFRHLRALKKFAPEVIARPSLAQKVNKSDAHGILAQLEPDPVKALGHLDGARRAAIAAGASCGPWDVAELSLRIARGEAAEADRVMQHIRQNHLREPAVAQSLFQVLSDAGIINADGSLAAPPAEEPAALVVPGAAAAEAGKIWTPGGEAAPSGKKSAIWTPGQ